MRDDDDMNRALALIVCAVAVLSVIVLLV